MKKVKPIYIKLLVAAAVIYVIGTAIIVSDLYYRVGGIEHTLTCTGHTAHK